METLIPQRKRLAGFSLVEMAIVILIAGIMMSAGLSLLSVKQAAAQFETTKKNQESIKQALINYLGKNLRLPCPGNSNGAEIRIATASLPPCSSYSGVVPYQTLGLDRAAALDGWENFITYVVSPSPIAATLPATIPPAPIWTTAWLYSYSTTPATPPCSATTCSNTPTTGTIPVKPAFWPSTSTGGIKVTTDGTITIADPGNATGAAVVLISYGKNGYGALNVKGTNAQPPAANIYEVPNAASSVATAGVIKRDSTETFDDIVMILSANDLTGPLIANGTLQSGAQAALSQANDIVMGNIVASRLPCPGTAVLPVCTTSIYYYTIPAAGSITFSSSWGVSQTLPAMTITIDGQYSSAPNAYTLTAGDGTTKTVLIGELRGILTRGAGF